MYSRRTTTFPRQPRGWLFSLVLVALLPAWSRAGGGPENVALVVNRKSWQSLAIANHYAKLRGIPAVNIVQLDGPANVDTVPIADYRTQILQPLLKALADRQILGQIDYVVYSCDLPYTIDFSADGPAKVPPEHRDKFRPIGSLTGVTYLWQLAMNKVEAPAMVAPQINQYQRISPDSRRDETTRGFRSWYGWDRNGRRQDVGGQHYLLSTMLGVTTSRGNTLPEILAYLRRSAAADGTRPRGTIYFARNEDVRSKARHDFFPDTVADLKSLGISAEIVSGKVPLGKRDVQGVVVGTADFDWKGSGSTIQPGAICEHFTSFGGILRGGVGQTPLTEWLRHGAAGASGTVAEPYSLWQKFPHPHIHVHYARGCTLAEAFYQSVFGPYQLLIVGDPLCRPWADIPQVDVAGLPGDGLLRGAVELKPTATYRAPGTGVDHFELFIDGVRRGKCGPRGTFHLDTASLADGVHEFRIVAVDNTPIETQGRKIVSARCVNHAGQLTATPSARRIPVGQPLTIEVASAGKGAGKDASKTIGRIVITHQHDPAATIDGASGQATIDTRRLGPGPVVLHVLALKPAPSNEVVGIAPPIELEITGEPAR